MVVVRSADPAEFVAIGDLRVAAYRADGHLTEGSRYAETLRTLGWDGSGEVLVAVDGPALLGTVMLQPWPAAGEVVQAPDEAEVRALAVAPQARGRGAGRALLCAVTELAARRGVRHLVLLTMPSMRAAHHLYAQAGFQRLPERDRYPAPGVELLSYGRILDPPG
ncbi:MAG TPA: GNAT family N-acetyltransferase [Streptosporangiaceae bacterium]|nr:GNAT family N-acetyltransferase [Streptosporangiaceae bacterium]